MRPLRGAKAAPQNFETAPRKSQTAFQIAETPFLFSHIQDRMEISGLRNKQKNGEKF